MSCESLELHRNSSMMTVDATKIVQEISCAERQW